MIVWNGTVVTHRTILFFDEISDRKLRRSNAFDDIYESDSGALICTDKKKWINQLWFFADGTTIKRKPYTIHSSDRVIPDIARVQRKRRSRNFPKRPEYIGLWSCQRFTMIYEESLYVAVYVRPGIRSGMLATGY